MELPTSVLTKKQVKTYGPKMYTEGGRTYRLTAKVYYDDSCGNGHNTFSITGAQYRRRNDGGWEQDSFGCYMTPFPSTSQNSPPISSGT